MMDTTKVTHTMQNTAKHSTTCEQPINWEGAKIVGRESKMTQRKFLEGVITLKERGKADNLKCVQPIRTLATRDIPVCGDLNGKTIVCVTFVISVMEVAHTQNCQFKCCFLSSSNHNVIYF